jgi:MtN3 and saliva related transmembrane protein
VDLSTVIGTVAAFCTTVSCIGSGKPSHAIGLIARRLSHDALPQLKKCWDTGSAGELSFRMLLILATGVAL